TPPSRPEPRSAAAATPGVRRLAWSWLLPDQVEEVPRRHGLDAESLRAPVVSDVVRDYMPAPRREREFENHVVGRIWQERPPQEVDLLQVRLTCQVAHEAQCVFRGEPRRQVFRPR